MCDCCRQGYAEMCIQITSRTELPPPNHEIVAWKAVSVFNGQVSALLCSDAKFPTNEWIVFDEAHPTKHDNAEGFMAYVDRVGAQAWVEASKWAEASKVVGIRAVRVRMRRIVGTARTYSGNVIVVAREMFIPREEADGERMEMSKMRRPT